MTEQEWLSSTNPRPMLQFLLRRGSDRKFRLFAVGCCRRIWHLIRTSASRRPVEVAERYADGKASDGELDGAARGATQLVRKARGTDNEQIEKACAAAADSQPWDAARDAAWAAVWAVSPEEGPDWDAEYQSQAELLRCLFGNPFRPISVDATWVSWNDGAVVKLARAIYDERAFDRLPLLADALEEAGCTESEVLAHCRDRGEHSRGCWVVDMLLNRE